MSKIDKLTPDQEKKLVEFREEWLKIGLATGEANIIAITPTINEFYKRIGKSAPYIWQCQSPLQAQILINLLKRDDFVTVTALELFKSINRVAGNISNNVDAPLYGDIRDQIWGAMSSTMFHMKEDIEQSFEQLCTKETKQQLLDTYGDNWLVEVAKLAKVELVKTIAPMKFEYTNCYLYGSLDSYWIAWLLFPHLHLRPMHTDEQMELLHHWENLAKNCFWWYPFEGVCFVCDRPTEIHKDERGRLHSSTDPAVSFSDGWKMYYVNGVEVSAYVIEHPEQITADDILKERNVEVRRVKLDKYEEINGKGSFVVGVGAKMIQVDGYGELYRIDMPDDEPYVAVKVVNATPEMDNTYRDYWLRVPPTMKTAHEAVAWTFKKKPEEYAPELET